MYGTTEERLIRLLSAADENITATFDGVEDGHAHYLLSAGDIYIGRAALHIAEFYVGRSALYVAQDGSLHPMEGWLALTDEVQAILDDDEDEVRVSRDDIYDAALSACVGVDLDGGTR
jgi:hypothetical protein